MKLSKLTWSPASGNIERSAGSSKDCQRAQGLTSMRASAKRLHHLKPDFSARLRPGRLVELHVQEPP